MRRRWWIEANRWTRDGEGSGRGREGVGIYRSMLSKKAAIFRSALSPIKHPLISER